MADVIQTEEKPRTSTRDTALVKRQVSPCNASKNITTYLSSVALGLWCVTLEEYENTLVDET